MPESEDREPPPGEMNPRETVPAPQDSSQEMPANGQATELLPADEPVHIEDLDAAVLANSRRRTRRSFAVAAAAAAAGYGLYRWIEDGPREEMQPDPFRCAFQFNARVSRSIFAERALAPTYPLGRAENLRVNGVYGLHMTLDPDSYRLQVVGVRDSRTDPRYVSDVTAWEYKYMDAKTAESRGHDTKTPPPSARTAEKMAPESMMEEEKRREMRSGRMPRGREEAGQSRSTLPQPTAGLLLTMSDILRLPRHELVTQFKCIEGWSQIVHWAGVRMADFLEEYPPDFKSGKEPQFVYMETPDGDYYTAYDMKVCRHPQTLLVTEMMGAPLTQYHGAPLRLHMPTKYGYKQIKRIGLVSYNTERPDDYWTKLGYDWYAGL
jgi:Oxidoreductase molybdopterin binding domain